MAWPLVVRAQQPSGVKRIGVLGNGAATDPARQTWIGAFIQTLRNLGWVDGQNVRIDVRWNDSDAERAREYAEELVRLSPDVILATSTLSLVEALRATQTIPIVFNQVSDPVRQGFVPNLVQPGGNATEFAAYEFSIGGKWLDLLKQIAPGLARVGVMFNPDTSPQSRIYLDSVRTAAAPLSVEVVGATVRNIAEIESAIRQIALQAHAGLIFPTDSFTATHQKLIIDLAARSRLPTISANNDAFARDGGLMYYGAPQRDQYRGAAFYVDRILKGEKPGNLPIQLPIRYELIINLRTATALGIQLPMSLMLSATEVIE